MSSAPVVLATSRRQDARASEIEVLADNFLAFVEEFEAALGKEQVLPAFAERLAQLIQRAERLV